MPTYEYRCRECGETLEVVHSIHDDPPAECPACGGDLRKVFSPVGIAFKGSGFYKTDSRSSSTSSSSSRTSSGSTDSGESGDGAKSSDGASSSESSSSGSGGDSSSSSNSEAKSA